MKVVARRATLLLYERSVLRRFLCFLTLRSTTSQCTTAHRTYCMGCAESAPATHSLSCANGTIRVGSRVQTQWDEGPHCDYKWYVGTVTRLFRSGNATITYDDPDEWTGAARYIYLLLTGHPGLTSQVAMGAPTTGGPHGMAVPAPEVVVAQPLALPVVVATAVQADGAETAYGA